MKFQELNLAPELLKALNEEKYTEPTSIQSQSIPLALSGHDILGSAQTGTGKTAAFALPILQHLLKENSQVKGRREIKSLILTPTRELAIQINESIDAYSRHTSLRNMVIYGGVNQNSQVRALQRGTDILIATPGRLLDLMNQGYISLKSIKYFVLDEADRMLDMGFINDIKKVIAVLPKQRQTLFFSATLPDNIQSLSKQILINPRKVAVNPVSSTAETIQQYLYKTNKDSKKSLLFHLLEDKDLKQVLVFSRTKHGADKIVKTLKKQGIESAAIHGNKNQNQRQKALNAFKDNKVRLLVATDIAARGIDIDKLRYVINYDIPNEPETYVHRIGRCGRAGESGISISLCEPEELAYVKEIEKLTSQSIKVISDHPFPQTDRPMTASEKKEVEKEKQARKREFFANRKKNSGGKDKRNTKNSRRR